jgi:hypothetical protein
MKLSAEVVKGFSMLNSPLPEGKYFNALVVSVALDVIKCSEMAGVALPVEVNMQRSATYTYADRVWNKLVNS